MKASLTQRVELTVYVSIEDSDFDGSSNGIDIHSSRKADDRSDPWIWQFHD